MSQPEATHDYMPLLSVIVPALSPTAELARCIYSILAANTTQFAIEIIIVIPSCFLSEAESLYPDVRVCPESRTGIYSAMNDGVRVSKGKFLLFVGIDDIILPALGDALFILFNRRPFALFANVYWGANAIYSGKPSRFRLLLRNMCHQGIIYSRDAIVQHGPYNVRMKVQADHFLNIRILWDRGQRHNVVYLNKALCWYSAAGFSSKNIDLTFWRLYPRILRNYVGHWAYSLICAYRQFRRLLCAFKKF
jgi:glycosyltransferase involved in cell wall biosynthesis